MKQTALIDYKNFILATRDSGYKTIASAFSELVDNSIEAGATEINIQIDKIDDQEGSQYEILIVDNGCGMNAKELNLALQFGGSSRFNSRHLYGRYGMGLPNSSLSQCKRVEVITWKHRGGFLSNYLDIDEIVNKNLSDLPEPQKSKICRYPVKSDSGTIVVWRKCDRIYFKYLKSLIKNVLVDLGRTFRYSIWQGVSISVCEEKVIAWDPLFIGEGSNMIGGTPYGEEITYQVKVPGSINKTSPVNVRFVELPVHEWSKLSNDEKRKQKITKCAGISILRAKREIDYGWFFMGEKRKENYDDWWRCEISFNPELDEVFGVTHTKQEIKQTEFMKSILVPDMEQIARVLNNRVRLKFIEQKKTVPVVHSKQLLERTDVYLPPVKLNGNEIIRLDCRDEIRGFQYIIETEKLTDDVFFSVKEDRENFVLVFNTNHVFYEKIFKALHQQKIQSSSNFLKIIEILMFAAARSEFVFAGREEEKAIKNFKKEWSSHLNTYFS